MCKIYISPQVRLTLHYAISHYWKWCNTGDESGCQLTRCVYFKLVSSRWNYDVPMLSKYEKPSIHSNSKYTLPWPIFAATVPLVPPSRRMRPDHNRTLRNKYMGATLQNYHYLSICCSASVCASSATDWNSPLWIFYLVARFSASKNIIGGEACSVKIRLSPRKSSWKASYH